MEEMKRTERTEEIKPLEKKKSSLPAWVLFGLSIVYAFLPVDIIPDLPGFGWIDDFFLVSSCFLNLVQAECQKSNEWLGRILRLVKWIVIFLGVICVSLLLLFGTLLIQLFSK